MPDTTSASTFPSPEQLRQEAFALCQQSHEAQDPAFVVSRIHAWRARSPAHEACWQRVSHQWEASGAIRRQRETGLLTRARLQADLGLERLRQHVRERPAPAVLAACCLLVVLVLPLLRNPPAAAPPATAVALSSAATVEQTWHYSSAPREQRSVTLDDGSRLTLNWNSSVRVHYTPLARRLELERGEAHFDVMPDASRPFTVAVGTVTARAVGTAFSVRRDNGSQAQVTVSEGVVEISTGTEPALTLTSNQQVDADAGNIGVPVAIDATNAQAWTGGILVFEAQPLHEVLRELGRYTSLPLETGLLFDPGRPVTATYFIDRADAALSLIAEAFDLHLRRTRNASLLIESPPPNRPQ